MYNAKNCFELMKKLVQKQEELGTIRWSDNISSYSARNSKNFSRISKITVLEESDRSFCEQGLNRIDAVERLAS